MNRSTLKALAAFAVAAVYSANGLAQHCQPTCAAPHEPVCAVPPVPCDPTCAAPSGCSTSGSCQTCYQPQQVHCQPESRGLFGCARPLFNWTKIEIESRERCQPQAQCCQTAQPTMAVPMMTMQPVQLQMTAYQPVMAAPQFVQAAPQFVQAAPQMVAAAPQFVQAAPQMLAAPQFVSAPQMVAAPQFVSAPQMVAAPQTLQIASRPADNVNTQLQGDDCNLSNVCQKLSELRKQVNDLATKVDQKDSSDLERRVAQLEESSKLQTDILKEMKTFFEKK